MGDGGGAPLALRPLDFGGAFFDDARRVAAMRPAGLAFESAERLERATSLR
jgi:hypothetical protein